MVSMDLFDFSIEFLRFFQSIIKKWEKTLSDAQIWTVETDIEFNEYLMPYAIWMKFFCHHN